MSGRWRRQPDLKGLARVAQLPRGLEYRVKGEIVISVYPSIKNRFEIEGYYWVCRVGDALKNTCDTPCKTMDEAQQQSEIWYKRKLKEMEKRV